MLRHPQRLRFVIGIIAHQHIRHYRAVRKEAFHRFPAVSSVTGDITADETDYRAKLRVAKDDAEKDYCVRMVALKRLGVTANKNLDAAFSAIFN